MQLGDHLLLESNLLAMDSVPQYADSDAGFKFVELRYTCLALPC